MDFNLQCIQVICDCLQIEMPTEKTTEYIKDPIDHTDYRFLANAKRSSTTNTKPYIQVFNDRHAFIPNLSILDLLFNEGTNALNYLKSHKTDY